MKNIYLAVFLNALLSSTYGSFSAGWASDGWMLENGSNSSSASPIGGDPNASVVYALFAAPDINSQFLLPSGGGGTLNWSGDTSDIGNNYFLSVGKDNFQFDRRNINFSGVDVNNQVLPNSGTLFFYSVAFDYTDANIMESDSSTWNFTVPQDTFLYITPLIEVSWTADPLALPTDVFVNEGGVWGGEFGAPTTSAIVNTQLIPEPGTLALMLIAGAGMALTMRRRRS